MTCCEERLKNTEIVFYKEFPLVDINVQSMKVERWEYVIKPY